MATRIVASAGVFLLIAAGAVAAGDDGTRRISAPTRQSLEFRGVDEPRQMDFDFGTGTGWARSDGAWSLSATVQHNGLLCGTYAVGVRFGFGPGGCANPTSWSSTRIISTTHLCNNASREIRGNGQDPDVGKGFNDLGCAQLLVRCDGNCK